MGDKSINGMGLVRLVSSMLNKEVTEDEAKQFALQQFGVLCSKIKSSVQPRVVVFTSGGVVQSVMSDGVKLDVEVVDADIEMFEPDEVAVLPNQYGDKQEAGFYTGDVSMVNKDIVNEVFTFKKQL